MKELTQAALIFFFTLFHNNWCQWDKLIPQQKTKRNCLNWITQFLVSLYSLSICCTKKAVAHNIFKSPLQKRIQQSPLFSPQDFLALVAKHESTESGISCLWLTSEPTSSIENRNLPQVSKTKSTTDSLDIVETSAKKLSALSITISFHSRLLTTHPRQFSRNWRLSFAKSVATAIRRKPQVTQPKMGRTKANEKTGTNTRSRTISHCSSGGSGESACARVRSWAHTCAYVCVKVSLCQ